MPTEWCRPCDSAKDSYYHRNVCLIGVLEERVESAEHERDTANAANAALRARVAVMELELEHWRDRSALRGSDSVGGDGCTAGDGKAIDCRHCGAPPGVTCADHKAQRSSEASPSDETLDDRTSLLNDVCNWLNEHGYGAAARHLYDVRSDFQLAPQRSETPIPLDYETGYREGQSSVLADVDHILDEADSDADALAALRKLVSSETGSGAT